MRTIRHFAPLTLALLALLISPACNFAPPTAKITIPKTKPVNEREVQVEAVVMNLQRQTVPGIQVIADTSSFTDSDYTNSEGKVTLNVIAGDEQPIDFRFLGSGIQWTETLPQIPPGIVRLKIIFKMDNLGRITTGAIQY